MKPFSLTVVILTFNEAQHIKRCIDSVKDIATDIIVIDSLSTDETVTIAESSGARVLQNPWTNHAIQFQWGLDNADIKTEWIMRLDADEYLESESSELISQLSSLPTAITGVYIRRKIFYLGQWIKYGAIYPIYTLRLWKNGAGRMENRWMDEHIVLIHGDSVSIDINIVDDNENSISWWVEKHNSYATKEMIEILNHKYHFFPIDNALLESGSLPAKIKRFIKNNIYNNFPLFIRPTLYFIYRYIVRLGFMDGQKGYAFHFMQGYWYRTLVDLKVLEAEALICGETDPEIIKDKLTKFTKLKL